LRDVRGDIPPTPTCVTRPTKSPAVDIQKPSHVTSSVTPADCDSDRAAVGGGQCRQSYASVVSTRRDGPRDRAVDSMELPCPGEWIESSISLSFVLLLALEKKMMTG